ncbi:MAG: uL15 family ribosomal protein [Clostridia bacterium]|nr:uL15 family ribosomal protein [Clostridia bacterium]
MKRKGILIKLLIPLVLVITLLTSFLTLGAFADGTQPAALYTVDFTTATNSGDGVARISLMLDASIIEGGISLGDTLEGIKAGLMEALYEIAYDAVFVIGTSTPAPAPINASLGGTVLPNIDLTGIDIADLEGFLRTQLDTVTPDVAREKLDKLMEGDFDHVIEIAIDRYLDTTGYTSEQIEAKTSSVMDSIIDALYSDEPDTAEEKKQTSKEKIGEIVAAVDEARENGEDITFTLDDLNTVSKITVDAFDIFENGSFSLDAVRALLDTLPDASEIRSYSDTEMIREFAVSAEFVFGEIAFDLTLGLEGDCELIRRCAGIIDDYITVSEGDGALSVEITVPKSISDLLAEAINEGDLSEELKSRIFSLGMKTGEDIDLFLKDFSFEDMKDMLAELDLTDLLSDGPLSGFIDTEGKSNDEILAEMDKLERAYGIVLDLTSSFMSKLPDSKLSMTLLDVYDGEGVLGMRDDITFTLEGLFTSVSERYGALLASFFDEGAVELELDVRLVLEAVRRVTYQDPDGEVIADGFLPEGAELSYFAGTSSFEGKKITGWYSGSQFFTAMPCRDVQLFAYYGGHIEANIASGVSATYSPNLTHNLSAEATYLPISGDYTLSYQWLMDGQELLGATGSTYTVSAVSDSGYYTCLVTVSEGTHLASAISPAVSVSILPAEIDVSSVSWNYTTPYVYSGREQSVFLTGLPEGLTASYTNYNSDFEPIEYQPSNAGTYITSVRLNYDRRNYTLKGNSFAYTLEWRIAKATVDMSGITLEPKTVYYDGKAHSIEITGSLPDGVTVTYVGGGTEVGEYLIKARFTVDTVNYNPIRTLEARLTILPSGTAPTDPDARDSFKIYNSAGELLAQLTARYPIAKGIDFKVYPRELTELDNVDWNALFGGGKEIFFSEVYDLHFEDSVGEIDVFNNSFTVKLLIPKGLRDKEDLAVVHLSGGAATAVNGAVREGDYMTFETDSFSLFAVVAIEEADELLWLWIILLIILIIVVILIIFRRPEEGDAKDNEPTPEDEPAEEAPIDEATEEAPAEETPTEEAPTEEAPIEEALAEEAPTEEAPTEEALTEEAPTEEAPTEEAPTEEAPTEEAPAEEAPTEETPTEEALAEEAPAEEAPTEEAPAEEAPAEEASGLAFDTVMVRYRSSFTSRLIQSETVIQDYYTTLKNYILSFEGVKSRCSFGYEAFNLRRTALVRLNVKGKAILVNLALDPTQYSESKYHFTVDDKLAELPMLMKVKSERALKYTLELIDEVMSTLGIDQGDIPEVDYHMPYETNSELAKRGLVKVILPKGVALTDTTEVLETDISELLGTDRAVSEAEQIMDSASGSTKVAVRYRGSFTSRLIQSGDRTQDFYTDIRNYLLSYTGVKSRTSWNYETYNKGRVKLARINIKGKTLTVNLALAPSDFSKSKYHFTDMSDDPKLEKLPMQMKVRSERAKKYVIALIDELMKGHSISQGDIPTESYRMPYETNDELVARGLMKLVLGKGAVLNEDDETVNDVGAFISGTASEEAVAPETESSPETEPAISPVAEPVFADSTLADALIDDTSANELIEHIHEQHGSGRLIAINIGEICMHFDKDEKVTLSALKRRGLVAKRYGRVKILAGGIMTKPLTVVADEFSASAVKMITLAGGVAKQID